MSTPLKKIPLHPPALRRRPEMPYRLIVFDIDGTLTRHISSWRYIHERLGLWDALARKYQEAFLKGRISYQTFCRLDAAHWKGLAIKRMEELFAEVPYSKNTRNCIRYARRLGLKLAAVSTGLQFITDRVKNELGFDVVIGNRLRAREGILTGGVDIRICHGGKGRIVRLLAKRFRIRPEKMICVGDSEGDVPMAQACGYAIAFRCTSARLRRYSDYVCKTEDFDEVRRVLQELLEGRGRSKIGKKKKPTKATRRRPASASATQPPYHTTASTGTKAGQPQRMGPRNGEQQRDLGL